MPVRFRVPAGALAVALLALIALLATLQYRWLGRISEAERERMQVTLTHHAREFAQEFDREVTRAYLLFQDNPLQPQQDPAVRMAERVDRWQATAAFPRLLKEYYLARRDAETLTLLRYDAQRRQMDRVDWPASMRDWREQFTENSVPAVQGPLAIRRMPAPVWDSVPAIVVPTPLLFLAERIGPADVRTFTAQASYIVLAIDLEYVRGEMLPALAQRHFRGTGDGFDSHVAVVSATGDSVLQYQSNAAFAPKHDSHADAAADLFQVRTQDFNTIASEIRRFTALSTIHVNGERGTVVQHAAPGSVPPAPALLRPAPREVTERITSTLMPRPAGAGPRWRLLLKHPSGSLDAAVNAVRRRNLVISMSILAVLGASMGLLVLSTRRAQQLARQQMEFVAAVSHELRTPLAVIRSAAENLADGVVQDATQIRRYGQLVRCEGRRLSEMVEQILEFAGIQSGQRGMNLRPLALAPLLSDILSASSALIEAANLKVEFDVAESIPPVLGDEPALRRVFQNLIGNAIKYGEAGNSILVHARASGTQVMVSVIDHGIGIAPAEQARIFEPFYRAPDVVSAQIQGAGLGLSLVQRIVDVHGGKVSVMSAPGEGSQFMVTLPAAISDPRAHSTHSPAVGMENPGTTAS